jgi:ABC-type transport system involved in multi-copper enzyme maturation permease subunit
VKKQAKDFARPSTVRVAAAIARVTFFEVIRDKILYNIIVCAGLLFAIGFLASRLTFLRPERVTLDFGLSAVNISCAMIAIFTGASLIGREFERRTIFVALSHPISRAQFVLGKFAGIASVIAVNWVLLSGTYLLLLWLSADTFGSVASAALFAGLLLLLLQSWVIAGVAILFSTFSTTSLSAIFAIGIYLVGNNISEIRAVAARVRSPAGAFTLNGVATLLPNLEHFNLGNRVTYGLPVEPRFVWIALVYGMALVAFLLYAAGLLIRGREV